MVFVYLSLGTNRGDRFKNISTAIKLLDKEDNFEIESISSVYRTFGVNSGADMPEFLNCVLKVRTSLKPQQVLERCQSIEKTMGRVRKEMKTPRIIDIDIILYNDEIVSTEYLTIPHPKATRRRFVLVPLNEIEPELRFPDVDKSIEELLSDIKDESSIEKVKNYN